jgi:hypothetical protein
MNAWKGTSTTIAIAKKDDDETDPDHDPTHERAFTPFYEEGRLTPYYRDGIYMFFVAKMYYY